MPEYAFLSGLVVIRSDDQRRVSPSGLRRLHMLKRGHGVVRSAPGDYRDTSRSLLDADFYDAFMFLNRHGGAFPRGATGYNRSAVFGDLPRSGEHTSELPSLMRTSYVGFCLHKTYCY